MTGNGTAHRGSGGVHRQVEAAGELHSTKHPQRVLAESGAGGPQDSRLQIGPAAVIVEELHDYFGGRADLKARVLRAASAAFSEDPLRVLRGMQFACRFDLTVDAATAAMCRSIAGHYGTLPKERVCEEFMKWAAKSRRPGKILEYLDATGWLAHFPLLDRIRGVPQDPEWHPEGDVATHTMHVVDA